MRDRWLPGVIGLLLVSVAATAQAAPIGSSALFPAFSAKEILAEGASVGSGLYWFDPDGLGGNAPFQGYADMTTAGGGWNLALLSLPGSPSSTTDIVSNTGTVSLATGHTRDMTQLAVTQSAEIMHEITASTGVFHGYYTGMYHGQLATLGGWTFLADHTNTNLLNYHFGMNWSTAANDQDTWSGNCAANYGQPWYYAVCWSAIPVNSILPNGPYVTSGSVPATKYAIWVRADGQTEYTDPDRLTAVPEPTTLVLFGGGLAVAARRLRKRR